MAQSVESRDQGAVDPSRPPKIGEATVKIRIWNKRPIAMPGVYSGMPLSRYHAADACVEPSISSSGLRKILKDSPRHYWSSSPYNPNRVEPEETEALVLGRAAHHLLFGESDFRKLFTVRPATVNGEPWHSNKIICKAWLRQAEGEGLTVLTTAQLEQVKGIAGSLADDPAVRAGCLNGAIEHSWFYKDKKTGVWIKVRPDANPTGDLSFVDLKLTRSTDAYSLERTMRDYRYYQQASLTATACEEVLGRPMDSFSFFFVESNPPFDVEFVIVKDDEIVRSQKENRLAIDRFADCMRSGKWPGRRGDRAEPKWIERPTWEKDKIDEMLKTEFGASS